tara:strand:+ start:2232 stop:3077 length:846 start_codon:yes stop_codon:yes gene_type:complete
MYQPLVISSSEYHSHPNDSSSNVRAILDNDKKYILQKEGGSITESKALVEGTVVHTYFGERDLMWEQYVLRPDGLSFSTKEGKAWKAEEAKGRTILDSEWGYKLEKMEESFNASPAKDLYTDDGLKEKSFFWEDLHEINCKCRPDWISKDYKTLIDLKTTVSAEPRAFKRSIQKYRYDIQAAFYMRGIEMSTGVKPENFYFIAMEKVAPFCIGVYRIAPLWLSIGWNEVEEALFRINSLKERGMKPIDYTPEVMDLNPPTWMNKKDPEPVKDTTEEIELFL